MSSAKSNMAVKSRCNENSNEAVERLKFQGSSSPFASIASSSLASMGGEVSGRENCSVKSGRQKPGGNKSRLSANKVPSFFLCQRSFVIHFVASNLISKHRCLDPEVTGLKQAVPILF